MAEPEGTPVTSIPDWMRPESERYVSGICHGSRRGQGALRRASGLLARMLSELGTDDTSVRPSSLSRIDARAKVLGLVGLIVVCTIVRSLYGLAACCSACLIAAGVCRIPARRVCGAWLAVPVFSAVIMLPAMLEHSHARPVFAGYLAGSRRAPGALAITRYACSHGRGLDDGG